MGFVVEICAIRAMISIVKCEHIYDARLGFDILSKFRE